MPTLAEFKDRFLDGYARANRQKPSGIAANETVLGVHWVPLLGSTRLDDITTEDVQRLKHQLRSRAPKTVNNVLTMLNVLLKKAVEWDVIERMACTIRLLPIPKPSAGFYDFDEYERLLDAGLADDRNAYLIVLLGEEAGLRCGEMMALEWSDVDLAKRQLRVERSDWKGDVTATKGGRVRYVPLTARLAAVAMRGAPARAIQELAVIRISRRRSGTCTSVRRRLRGGISAPRCAENQRGVWQHSGSGIYRIR